MKRTIVSSALFLLIFAVNSSAQSVTGLKAIFKNGQTFLTWNNIKLNKNITYYVYRSKKPFQHELDFTKNHFVAKVYDSSAYNTRLSHILNKHVFFRINENEEPLNFEKCLYVQTATDNQPFYYAVIVYTNGKTMITIEPGRNTILEPVEEKIEHVKPVYQMTVDTFGHSHDIYTHWVSKFENDKYPSMTSTYCYAYNFAVIKKGNEGTHTLYIYLHARGSNFLTNIKGTKHPGEWILSLDDYLPNSIGHTFWYGYHENFNFFNPDTVPKKGLIIDYTVRRVRWTIEWLTNNFSIDTNKIYLSGGSMGGGGSVFLGMALSDKITAINAVLPKFDYSFTKDPDNDNIYNLGTTRRKNIEKLWGSMETNLMTSDNLHVYNRLNAGYMAKLLKDKSLPYIIAFNGKNDDVVGWAEKIAFYKAFEESRHGGCFFWDSRSHSDDSKQEWHPEYNPEKMYKFSLHESYPAFTNCSANNNPGDGNAKSGDAFGSINGHLTWGDSIIDNENYYEISIYPIALRSLEGPINAPNSFHSDITLRRIQHLTVDNNHAYYYQNIRKDGVILQDGYFDADKDNLLTIKHFHISNEGNTLIIFAIKREEGNF